MSAAATDTVRPRLVLVTPRPAPGPDFSGPLAAALSGGDVAAVVIDLFGLDDIAGQALAEALVPVAQAAGAAAIVAGDTRIAGRAKADGVQLDVAAMLTADGYDRAAGAETDEAADDEEDGDGQDPAGAALAAVVERLQPAKMVGAGGLRGRHDAMLAAEAGVDYVFTGRLDLAEGEAPHGKTLAFADWWAPLFEIPCVALAGRSVDGVGEIVATGVEFVALRAAAWDHPAGPAAAVAAANAAIEAATTAAGEA